MLLAILKISLRSSRCAFFPVLSDTGISAVVVVLCDACFSSFNDYILGISYTNQLHLRIIQCGKISETMKNFLSQYLWHHKWISCLSVMVAVSEVAGGIFTIIFCDISVRKDFVGSCYCQAGTWLEMPMLRFVPLRLGIALRPSLISHQPVQMLLHLSLISFCPAPFPPTGLILSSRLTAFLPLELSNSHILLSNTPHMSWSLAICIWTTSPTVGNVCFNNDTSRPPYDSSIFSILCVARESSMRLC
ncbi:hypothetical protein T01_9286 [Trichinella spiralis]|uniref:Uncharacterized protein n=1 Tax=Trichinella spiralis TaxID=6334 RepID=A0A0V1BTF0_TRISP|nr:hypothetical protein T01_9286 [Trichinella spiralis]